MTSLFAQPYNLDATGFYFDSIEQYETNASSNRDRYGCKVEEYEIQFIDGERIDAQLARAYGLYQSNIAAFLDAAETWDDDTKIRYIIAVGEGGYLHTDDPDTLDIDLYEIDTLRELAEQFVEGGLFGEIPDNLRGYLDYDAIAYDLGMDYSEIEIDDRKFIYRLG